MQNLDDVFKLLRDAESAIRRSGWEGDDYSRPFEVRRIAERWENGDFQKAYAVIKAYQRGALTPAPAAAPDWEKEAKLAFMCAADTFPPTPVGSGEIFARWGEYIVERKRHVAHHSPRTAPAPTAPAPTAPDGLADLINACSQIGFPVVSDGMKPVIDAMQAALRKVRHSLADSSGAPAAAAAAMVEVSSVRRDAGAIQCNVIGWPVPTLAAIRGSTPPRITEQDARAIAESSATHYMRTGASVNCWFDEEGRDLLNKLNAKGA